MDPEARRTGRRQFLLGTAAGVALVGDSLVRAPSAGARSPDVAQAANQPTQSDSREPDAGRFAVAHLVAGSAASSGRVRVRSASGRASVATPVGFPPNWSFRTGDQVTLDTVTGEAWPCVRAEGDDDHIVWFALNENMQQERIIAEKHGR